MIRPRKPGSKHSGQGDAAPDQAPQATVYGGAQAQLAAQASCAGYPQPSQPTQPGHFPTFGTSHHAQHYPQQGQLPVPAAVPNHVELQPGLAQHASQGSVPQQTASGTYSGPSMPQAPDLAQPQGHAILVGMSQSMFQAVEACARRQHNYNQQQYSELVVSTARVLRLEPQKMHERIEKGVPWDGYRIYLVNEQGQPVEFWSKGKRDVMTEEMLRMVQQVQRLQQQPQQQHYAQPHLATANQSGLPTAAWHAQAAAAASHGTPYYPQASPPLAPGYTQGLPPMAPSPATAQPGLQGPSPTNPVAGVPLGYAAMPSEPVLQPLASHVTGSSALDAAHQAGAVHTNRPQSSPSPAPQSTHPLSLLAPQLPDDQNTLPSRSITSLSFIPGILPELQPGEKRMAGLTLHPAVAGWYQQRDVEWVRDTGARGNLQDFKEMPEMQVRINAHYQARADELGVNTRSWRQQVAEVLGLTRTAGEDVAPMNELRGVTPVAQDNLNDGSNRGRGLVAAQDLPKGYVLGVLGGYLLPGGMHDDSTTLKQINLPLKDIQAKGLPKYCNHVEPQGPDWVLDCRRYTFQLDFSVGNAANEEVKSVAVWGMGYGNSGMLINDAIPKWRKWVANHKNSTPEEAIASVECKGANVEVVVVDWRSQPIPILICSSDIQTGKPLRRIYGCNWWRAYRTAMEEVKEVHDCDDEPYEREPMDSSLPLRASAPLALAPVAAAPTPAGTAAHGAAVVSQLVPGGATEKQQQLVVQEVQGMTRGRDAERQRDGAQGKSHRSRSRSRERQVAGGVKVENSTQGVKSHKATTPAVVIPADASDAERAYIQALNTQGPAKVLAGHRSATLQQDIGNVYEQALQISSMNA